MTEQITAGTYPRCRRAQTLAKITEQRWDIVIVGGGITGAAIAREAALTNMKVLLVEKGDFASGSSSRTSKMVHGGLRYLAEKEFGLVRSSVRERQKLLNEASGLVEPLGFSFTDYAFQKFSRRQFKIGLRIYDLMARARTSRYIDHDATLEDTPTLLREGLNGSFYYADAATDDARLTLRVLQEALADGAEALNYVAAEAPLLGADQTVHGLTLRDQLNGNELQINCRLVINATGAWSDGLRQAVGAKAQMRPLRGTHLVVAKAQLPVSHAVTFFHPHDSRAMFARPWEGCTMIGTTDLDHGADMSFEPHASAAEVNYILEAAAFYFPGAELRSEDVISSWAGVRPVIGSGEADPSKESREHVCEFNQGMLTVTGGKLTTFRPIAIDALNRAREVLPELPAFKLRKKRIFAEFDHSIPADVSLTEQQVKRLQGRYGRLSPQLLQLLQDEPRAEELACVPGTQLHWFELRWAARFEAVQHLQDLLLRRSRIGFMTAEGGLQYSAQLKKICCEELGWDDAQWQLEHDAYQSQWRRHYGPPAVLAEEWPEEWQPE